MIFHYHLMNIDLAILGSLEVHYPLLSPKTWLFIFSVYVNGWNCFFQPSDESLLLGGSSQWVSSPCSPWFWTLPPYTSHPWSVFSGMLSGCALDDRAQCWFDRSRQGFEFFNWEPSKKPSKRRTICPLIFTAQDLTPSNWQGLPSLMRCDNHCVAAPIFRRQPHSLSQESLGSRESLWTDSAANQYGLHSTRKG